MSESRLLEIKKDIARMKDLYAENDYLQGDQILYSLQERHLDWLVQQAEKAQSYEDTLKYCQYQLKNGGKDKRTRIINAVDKALEGLVHESK